MATPPQPGQFPEAFVRWLRQVAPYVHAFRGRTFVVAFGGELYTERTRFLSFVHDLNLLAALEDDSTRKAVTAERAFLSGLGGGCSVPVAAHAKGEGQMIELTGLVVSEDGRKAIQVNRTGMDAKLLGTELAQRAIAQGANEILTVSVMQ